MKLLHIILLITITYNISFCKEEINLDELFNKLNENGITVGEDISNDKLYSLISQSNLQNKDINKIINQISSLLNSSINGKQELINNLKQNKNSSFNKEIIEYINPKSEEFDNISNIILKQDNNLSNSKLLNYLKSILN